MAKNPPCDRRSGDAKAGAPAYQLAAPSEEGYATDLRPVPVDPACTLALGNTAFTIRLTRAGALAALDFVRSPLAVFGAVVLLVFIVRALIGHWIAPSDR